MPNQETPCGGDYRHKLAEMEKGLRGPGLAREIAEAISMHDLQYLKQHSQGLRPSGLAEHTEARIEIIAARLAEANKARDERDAKVREAFDAAFILNSEGDPMYITANGVPQAIPARIRQKVKAALALLGGGDGD